MPRIPTILMTMVLACGTVAQAQAPYQPPSADAPGVPSPDAGLDSLMQELLNRAQPQLDQLGRNLGQSLGNIGPMFEDLGAIMDDVKNYQLPERQANGDILIRRKAGAPPPPPLANTFGNDAERPPSDIPNMGPDDAPDAAPTFQRDPQTELEL